MTHEPVWRQVWEQVGDLKTVEILVGIPSFNNAQTAEQVVRAVVAGLDRSFPDASVLVVSADAGSQDGTPEIVKQAVGGRIPTAAVQPQALGLPPSPLALHCPSWAGTPGRDQAFRAFFTVAEELQAKACAVIDANIRSVTPEWIERLVQPVLDKGADYVAPLFRRPRYEGSLTNSVIYPLSRALYGKRMRYHSGGGYGFSAKAMSVYLNEDVWTGDTARFGVDNWLTTVAVAEGCEVCQACLGARDQGPTPGGTELTVVLAQAVGAVFHFMERYQDVWEGRMGSSQVPEVGPPCEPATETVAIDVERMVKGFRQGLRDLLPVWEVILAPETLAGVLALGLAEAEEFRFPAPLWVQTVYDFALAYHERVLHREHVLKSLAPLYLGQTAALVLATRDGVPEEVERSIEAFCGTFEGMKGYLTDRWRFQ